MKIRVRRRKSPVWEDIDAAPPDDQDIAKRILWQPEDIESSLGSWWWSEFNGATRVLITEEE